MSSGPGEPLIGSCQPSRRPIDDYIEYYEEYQAHTDASKKYLSCYLVPIWLIAAGGPGRSPGLSRVEDRLETGVHPLRMDLLLAFRPLVRSDRNVQGLIFSNSPAYSQREETDNDLFLPCGSV